MSRRWLGVVVALLLLLGIALIALPAQGHTEPELHDWQQDWHARAGDHHALPPYLVVEYRDMLARHPCSSVLGTPCPSTLSSAPHLDAHAYSGMGTSVEQWRSLVQAYFGPNTNAALRVMACESGGNAHAMHPSSRASGLFQFLPSTWTRVTGEAYPGGVFEGNRNIEAAWKLSDGGTNWSQWSCKP